MYLCVSCGYLIISYLHKLQPNFSVYFSFAPSSSLPSFICWWALFAHNFSNFTFGAQPLLVCLIHFYLLSPFCTSTNLFLHFELKQTRRNWYIFYEQLLTHSYFAAAIFYVTHLNEMKCKLCYLSQLFSRSRRVSTKRVKPLFLLFDTFVPFSPRYVLSIFAAAV